MNSEIVANSADPQYPATRGSLMRIVAANDAVSAGGRIPSGRAGSFRAAWIVGGRRGD